MTKNQFVQKLFREWTPSPATCQIECRYHGVGVRFHTDNPIFADALNKFLPKSWKHSVGANPLEIWFKDPTDFADVDPDRWDQESDPDCQIIYQEKAELACQRDFVGIACGERILIVTPLLIDDGFFNGLRWILPRRMIAQGHVLLHSSCVVGRDGLAYFFLGPSGAGKTTVATLSRDRIVLGDDMNVMTQADGKLWAEPGLLGQRFSNPAEFANRYPVGAFFYLKKGPLDSLRLLSPAPSRLKFISSCANLFWERETDTLHDQLLNLSKEICNDYPFFELEFLLSPNFWRFIDGSRNEFIEKDQASFETTLAGDGWTRAGSAANSKNGS